MSTHALILLGLFAPPLIVTGIGVRLRWPWRQVTDGAVASFFLGLGLFCLLALANRYGLGLHLGIDLLLALVCFYSYAIRKTIQ